MQHPVPRRSHRAVLLGIQVRFPAGRPRALGAWARLLLRGRTWTGISLPK